MALSRELVPIQQSVLDLQVKMWGLRRHVGGVAERVAPAAHATQHELFERLTERRGKR